MAQRVICDAMLGKLARYLRVLGVDAAYCRPGTKKMLLLEGRREDRLILTRDRKLADMPGVLIVHSADPSEQLQQVARALKLAGRAAYFCRCIVCNASLVPIAKPEVAGRVPYYTYRNFENFSVCPACQRIYWAGSHHADMKRRIEAMLGRTARRRTRKQGAKLKRDEAKSR